MRQGGLRRSLLLPGPAAGLRSATASLARAHWQRDVTHSATPEGVVFVPACMLLHLPNLPSPSGLPQPPAQPTHLRPPTPSSPPDPLAAASGFLRGVLCLVMPLVIIYLLELRMRRNWLRRRQAEAARADAEVRQALRAQRQRERQGARAARAAGAGASVGAQ